MIPLVDSLKRLSQYADKKIRINIIMKLSFYILKSLSLLPKSF